MGLQREIPRHWRPPTLRGAKPDAAFRAVVREALAQIGSNARGVLTSGDPEFLHQLRVGMRRLRSALRAFRKILSSKRTKPLRRTLRRVSPILGRARDWDVLVGRLERDAAAAGLLAGARRERDRARKAARRVVASNAFARMLGEARALVPNESAKTLAQFAAAALDRAHRKLLNRGRIHRDDAAVRHALRIRVKRLRYGCEFFAPAFPPPRAAAYIAALKALQEILGDLNDIAVGRRLLGFDADETALLRKLAAARARFANQPVFWRAAD